MNNIIKGDEVRHGQTIYLSAASKAVIASLSEDSLSETMLTNLHDGSSLIFPTSAQKIAQTMKDKGEVVFAICLSDSKSCIGIAQLHRVSWQARHANLNIAILHEDYLTVEILQDVIQTMLQFVYWEANLNRIAIKCVDNNHLLKTAIENNGFTNEGRLRQEIYRNGSYLDVIVYSILAREWLANNK